MIRTAVLRIRRAVCARRLRLPGTASRDARAAGLAELRSLLLEINHRVVQLEDRVAELAQGQDQMAALSVNLREFADAMCSRIEGATALIEAQGR